MRVLRAKAARKALHFYKVTHGIRDPYTLLVDGTFVHHALVGVKTNLASRVEKVLGRDVRYAVPGPVLDELRSMGEAGAAALEFCRRRCRVIATPRACDTAAKAVLQRHGIEININHLAESYAQFRIFFFAIRPQLCYTACKLLLACGMSKAVCRQVGIVSRR